MEVKVCHVDVATEMVQIMGADVETRICYVQDSSGHMKLQLWAAQIGKVVRGHSYLMRNLSTREYLGCVFLTTTRNTEIVQIQELAGASSFVEFKAEEKVVTTLIGSIIRAEIGVSRRCSKCQAWQPEFNAALKFHRCQRCKLLQKAELYESTASGRVALLQEGSETDLTMTNSVIKRYLEKEGMLHLLIEGQNVEEHLLSGEAWQVEIQHDVVVGLDKVVEAGESIDTEEQEVAALMAVMEGEQV